jgi:GNAT superfamily N-acetyltransferase
MPMALLFQRPFTDDFVLELRTLAVEIFGDMDTDELAWRLSAMPDASVHATRLEGRIVAFKFGYAIERKRYLSWLGGVSRSHRRRGLARDLMARQHDWLRTRGYEYIETGAIKKNAPMLTLNLSVGFEVIGTYCRSEMPRVLMQKRLSE